MDNLTNNIESANGSKTLETEETHISQQVVETTEGESVVVKDKEEMETLSKEEEDNMMEVEDAFHLESKSLDNVSVSSTVLSSLSASGLTATSNGVPPGQQEGREVSTENAPTENRSVVKRLKQEKPKGRLSAAQKRQLHYLMQGGRTREDALALMRSQAGRAGASGTSKRQRSTDQTSPNTSGNGQRSKRARDRTMAPRPDTQRVHAGPGISYKEMTEATVMAVVPEEYPDVKLNKVQMAATRAAILDCIAAEDHPEIRPCFRSCTFGYGYLQIACADPATVTWLRMMVETINPWETASLKAISLDMLPKLVKCVGYFPDSKGYESNWMLRVLENQNYGLSTKEWRVVSRKDTTSRTVEMLLYINEASDAVVDAAQLKNKGLHYLFGKARLQKVKEEPFITGGSNSAVRSDSETQQSDPEESDHQHTSGSGLAVPTGTGAGLQPHAKASTSKAGSVRTDTQSGVGQQPPAVEGTAKNSTSVKRTVQPAARSGQGSLIKGGRANVGNVNERQVQRYSYF